MNIKALTFDLWDTLYIDDSDEKKRKELGLDTKTISKRQIFKDYIKKKSHLNDQIIDTAYNTCNHAFNKVWREHSITWPVAERLKIACDGLNIESKDNDFLKLCQEFEDMETAPAPDIIPGVKDVLAELKKTYKLGIISDTICTPGRNLRKLLRNDGIEDYFSSFVFSDEAGRSKPHNRVFAQAAKELNAKPHEIVHIGDRYPNDIQGAKKFGAKAFLCQVVKKRPYTEAIHDASFDDYAQLKNLLNKGENI